MYSFIFRKRTIDNINARNNAVKNNVLHSMFALTAKI